MHLSKEQKRRLLDSLADDLGPIVTKYLLDDLCEDIVYQDGVLWVKHLEYGWQRAGEISVDAAHSIVTTVGYMRNLEVNHNCPLIETILPGDYSRFTGTLPPLTENPSFAIRTRAKRIYTLAQYISDEIMTARQAEIIANAIHFRQTILFSGSPGSGKTTLLNAAVAELSRVCANDRIGIIEDTPEIQCSAANFITFLSSDNVSMLRCLKLCLRMSLDRIIVGETRDKAALVMLKAFNTGHPGGLTTLHANNSTAALIRLNDLVQEAIPGYDATSLIAEAIDLIVQIEGPRDGARRRLVTEMLWVKSYDKVKRQYETEPAV